MDEAGIERSRLYVTNAVKHFRFELRGKRRIHQTPRVRHLKACRPWLSAEIVAVQPELIVCLGAVAAKSLLGNDFRITADRGRLIEAELDGQARRVIATAHPRRCCAPPTDQNASRRTRPWSPICGPRSTHSDRSVDSAHAGRLLRRPSGGDPSVGDAVAAAVRIVRESGLPNETTSMFTTIEGSGTR